MFNLDLPSGKAVSFKAPSYQDRRQVLREFDRTQGYMAEDLLAARCLTHIDGSPVEESWAADPITFFDSWELKDQSFYLEVFMTMFALDEKAKNSAAEAAKKLMGATATTSKSPAKVKTTSPSI